MASAAARYVDCEGIPMNAVSIIGMMAIVSTILLELAGCLRDSLAVLADVSARITKCHR